jgi:hypothetical protein
MSQDVLNIDGDLFEGSTNSKLDSQVRHGQPQAYHKGYRVVGVPPRDVDGARRKHLAAQATAPKPKAWDENQWLMKARRKPVNVRPYELRAGAEQCAQLAINAHWQRVEIVELRSSRPGRSARSARGRTG